MVFAAHSAVENVQKGRAVVEAGSFRTIAVVEDS